MTFDVVRDDDRFDALTLFEIVVDPFSPHPTMEEIQLALAVHHHELFGAVRTREAQVVAVAPQARFGKNLLDDLGDGSLSEDPAVTRQPELPKARYQVDFVETPLPFVVSQAHPRQHAVEHELLLLPSLERERCLTAHGVREVADELVVHDLEMNGEQVGATQRLHALEGDDA